MKTDNEIRLAEWKTKDGRSIPVKEMKTPHIENSLALLKRQGFIGPKTLWFYLSCELPTADGALIAFESECDGIFDAPLSRFIDLFEEELERRAR